MTREELIQVLEKCKAELAQALDESKAETAACLEFLQNEMEWECFRMEMLYFDEPAKFSASERNAEKLKTYLKKKGHGIALLRELHELRRKAGVE